MSLQKFSWIDDAQIESSPPVEPLERHWRPQTRKDCETAPRPCPYVGCRHHLAVHVKGESISHSGPQAKGRALPGKLPKGMSVDSWSNDMLDAMADMTETCALDVAHEGGHTLDDIANLFGLSRERTRQIEEAGLIKLRKRISTDGLGDLLDAMASSPRRESALQEAQGQASIVAGDVAAMREAKG